MILKPAGCTQIGTIMDAAISKVDEKNLSIDDLEKYN